MASIVAALRGERTLFGTWVKIPALETVELLGWAGFDFVVVDLEHSPLNLESAYRAIVTAQAAGMAALVRVPDDTGVDAQRILDAGADGVLVPRVTGPAAAKDALARLVFPPAGERGMGRTSRAGRWGLDSMDSYLARGQSEVLRCVQIEDMESLRDIGAVLSLDHLGAVFIGMGDLTLSSGRPASDLELDGLIQSALDRARALGIPIGTAVGDADAARGAAVRGFDFVMVSNDASLFGQAARALVAAVAAAAPEAARP